MECYICGEKLQLDDKKAKNYRTRDHVVPKCRGIKTVVKNCCKKCNSAKADRDLIRINFGTIIKIDGIPYQLTRDAFVYGVRKNMNLNSDIKRKRKPTSNNNQS